MWAGSKPLPAAAAGRSRRRRDGWRSGRGRRGCCGRRTGSQRRRPGRSGDGVTAGGAGVGVADAAGGGTGGVATGDAGRAAGGGAGDGVGGAAAVAGGSGGVTAAAGVSAVGAFGGVASGAGASGAGRSPVGLSASIAGSISLALTRTPAWIRSHMSAGGSTGSTMADNSPSRRSHPRTTAAKAGSMVMSPCASARSSGPSVPSTYSAASTSLSWSTVTIRGTPATRSSSA